MSCVEATGIVGTPVCIGLILGAPSGGADGADVLILRASIPPSRPVLFGVDARDT